MPLFYAVLKNEVKTHGFNYFLSEVIYISFHQNIVKYWEVVCNAKVITKKEKQNVNVTEAISPCK